MLRSINRITKIYDTDYEFAIALFNQDMNRREDWLRNLSEGLGFVQKKRVERLVNRMRYKDE